MEKQRRTVQTITKQLNVCNTWNGVPTTNKNIKIFIRPRNNPPTLIEWTFGKIGPKRKFTIIYPSLVLNLRPIKTRQWLRSCGGHELRELNEVRDILEVPNKEDYEYTKQLKKTNKRKKKIGRSSSKECTTSQFPGETSGGLKQEQVSARASEWESEREKVVWYESWDRRKGKDLRVEVEELSPCDDQIG